MPATTDRVPEGRLVGVPDAPQARSVYVLDKNGEMLPWCPWPIPQGLSWSRASGPLREERG